MKKYLGIIKICNEGMNGINTKLITKTYNEIELLEKWISLYPNKEFVILNNTPNLDTIFKDFYDATPITIEEKENHKNARILLKKLMVDEEK